MLRVRPTHQSGSHIENVVRSMVEKFKFIKQKEVTSFAGQWMQPGIITLQKLNWEQKDRYHVFFRLWVADLVFIHTIIYTYVRMFIHVL